MTKEEKTKEELTNFQIRAVDLLGYHLESPAQPNVEVQTFSFNINLEQKIDEKMKSLIIFTNIDITAMDGKNPKLGSVSTGCLFTVENFDEVIKIEKDKHTHKISEGVLEILNSISVDATRGVMSQIFRGTSLHYAILPILDPKQLTKMTNSK